MSTLLTEDRAASVTEAFDIPLTAHFLGGAPISDSPATGVIDPYHRLWGHPGISVVDGSAVSANLGVNPSLTITAQAERAFSLWPNVGDADVRPAQADAYRRLDPIAAVPADQLALSLCRFGDALRRAGAAAPRRAGRRSSGRSRRLGTRRPRRRGRSPSA